MLTLFAKLLKILNSDARPIQIALAAALAMLAGLNSLFSLIGLITLMMLFLVRANLSSYFALTAVFALISLALAPLLSGIGEAVLTAQSLQPMFTDLYNQDWFRLFGFNNTLVMGSALVSILLFVPTLITAKILVVKYREALMTFVNKFKVVQTLKASKFYQVYESVKG